MLNKKKMWFAGIVAVSLLSVSGFASEGNGSSSPTVQPTSGRTVQLKCRFNGGGSDKSSWAARCRAEGSFDGAPGLVGEENMMTLRCDNDADGDTDTIFEGRIKVRAFDDTLVIKGQRDGDHDSDDISRPRIVINLGDGDHDQDDKSLGAELAYTANGYSYDIPGECRLDRGDN